MVKVNLLPSYYFEARKTKAALALTAALLFGLGAAMVYWVTGVNAELEALEAEIATVQPQADLSSKLASEAQRIATETQPIVTKTKFIEDILDFNEKFPLLFEETNRYTIPSVAYSQLQPAVTVLNLSGYAQRLSDIGRFLLTAQKADHLFAAVSITQGVPGWPPPEAGGGDTGAAPSMSPVSAPGGYGPTPGGYGPSPGGYSPGGGGGGGGTSQPGPVSYAMGVPVDLGGGFRFVPVSSRPQPITLPFSAVAQLKPPFFLQPPASPFMGGETDVTSTYGGYPGAGPVPAGNGVPGNGADMSAPSDSAPGNAGGGVGGIGGRSAVSEE